MPINIIGSFPLPLARPPIERLWQQTMQARAYPDDILNIRCLPTREMQALNHQYRHKNSPTNVLTFSYPGEHDIAICPEVVKEEAQRSGLPEAMYAAWVLVHAFVHVTGLDHERSAPEAKLTKQTEEAILRSTGYRQ